jgi:hypothetical protein
MADRPIIFSAPMVRALLDGSKTQTRRLLNPQPKTFLVDGAECDVAAVHVDGELLPRVATGKVLTGQKLAYAKGDRLYVREAFFPRPCLPERAAVPRYRADEDRSEWRGLWRPSIHMPRWASRLTLTVDDVRVERLQAISEVDARAEGAPKLSWDGEGHWFQDDAAGTFRCGFAGLWQHLHDTQSWDANPFVVALTFRVERGNIDRLG